MLKTTKISIGIVVGGSGFDLITTLLNLYSKHFYELNPLFHLFGAIPFIILYLAFTAGIVSFMYYYDLYFSISNHRLTILTMVTFALYGIFHLWLGYHNLSIFLF